MAKINLIAEPGKQEVVVERVFDAPRDKVFRMMTDPALIPKWWGPRELTTTVEKMDVKPGGAWRYIHEDTKGEKSAFNGVYHLVDGPGQMVSTFEYEGWPDQRHVMMETTVFEEVDGKTKVTTIDVFQTVADRDGMIASGMESGQTESMERFAKLLAEA